MSLRNIGVVFRKELLDICRDRRTLIFMILLPVAIIPLLTLAMGSLVIESAERLQERPSKIALLETGHAPEALVEFLKNIEDAESMQRHLEKKMALGDPFLRGILLASAEKAKDASDPEQALDQVRKIKFMQVIPFEAQPPYDSEAFQARVLDQIEAGTLDAVLIFKEGFGDALEEGYGAEYTLVISVPEDRSKTALDKIRRLFALAARGITLHSLKRSAVPKDVLTPIKGKVVNVGREENLLARLLPYLIILMCFSGGLYPAFDLGAGEKERGTLETLLVSPAQRTELVIGKFGVILFASLVAAALNVVSLSITLKFWLVDIPFVQLSFDPGAALLSFFLMLPLAATFAAILLSLSIFARSFREAQSYAVPLNFIIILPAFVSVLPGFELTPTVALIPVVNVSMALKEAWTGVYKPLPIALIFVSTLVYAGAAIAFCTSWFRREAVLFRS